MESNADWGSRGGLPQAFLTPGISSFSEFLKGFAPEYLPGGRPLPAGGTIEVPHGTTIVAISFPGGVLMAGDRRATMGNMIAQRDIEKVFPADEFSAVAFAGTAGMGVELVRLFQLELEHYEKIEGVTLSTDGKANRLATMLRGNLGMAMQGLAVVPLFAGYDIEAERGRIYSYDVTGGCYEEKEFYSVGSGSIFARGALKKLFRPDFTAEEAALAAVQALYDAAEDDSATGGPDLFRRIYPVVAVVTEDGYRRLPEEEMATLVESMVEARRVAPDGPRSPLR